MPKTPTLIKKGLAQSGLGFDSHRFGSAGKLVLGGVRFPGVPALHGHSDGDALLHAVIDALLGASGHGDIGEWFPDSAARWKGASSQAMLDQVMEKIRRAGYQPTHLDITVVADRPRLSSAKLKIRRALAVSLRLALSNVNLKAKTQEGLNWFGKEGGIAVWAVATVRGIGKKR